LRTEWVGSTTSIANPKISDSKNAGMAKQRYGQSASFPRSLVLPNRLVDSIRPTAVIDPIQTMLANT
jgi:hypothetical protein